MPRAMLVFEDTPEHPGQPRLTMVSEPKLPETAIWADLSPAQKYALLTFQKLGEMQPSIDPKTGAPPHDDADPHLG